MGPQLFKSSMIGFICVLFVYAGVLWVLDPCPSHEQRLSRAASEPPHEVGQSFNSETSDDSLPVLQCTPDAHLLFVFGPATLAASMLNALFKRTVTFSHHSDFSCRLFLSILQI
jgi:hypothetical protein